MASKCSEAAKRKSATSKHCLCQSPRRIRRFADSPQPPFSSSAFSTWHRACRCRIGEHVQKSSSPAKLNERSASSNRNARTTPDWRALDVAETTVSLTWPASSVVYTGMYDWRWPRTLTNSTVALRNRNAGASQGSAGSRIGMPKLPKQPC